MLSVYGYSDSYIEVYNSTTEEYENFRMKGGATRIYFEDGSQIHIQYGKENIGDIWKITVEKIGSAELVCLTQIYEVNHPSGGDCFTISSKIKKMTKARLKNV